MSLTGLRPLLPQALCDEVMAPGWRDRLSPQHLPGLRALSSENSPCEQVRMSFHCDQMKSTTMRVMSSCCVLEAGCQMRISESS